MDALQEHPAIAGRGWSTSLCNTASVPCPFSHDDIWTSFGDLQKGTGTAPPLGCPDGKLRCPLLTKRRRVEGAQSGN